jgi:galactoside O-acetyltransferase
MVSFLRKLQQSAAKRRLLANPLVKIDETAVVNWRGVKMRPGCGLTIGAETAMNGKISFDKDGASVAIGDRTFIGDSHIVCAGEIVIGDDVLIAWNTTVVDHNSHAIRAEDRKGDGPRFIRGEKDWSNVMIKPVKIESDAWIGFAAIILPGVTIGRGAVIGAGSIVAQDVPASAIVQPPAARVVTLTEEIK